MPAGIDYREKYEQIPDQLQKQNQAQKEDMRQLTEALTRFSQKMNRFIHDAQAESDGLNHMIELLQT